MKKLLTFALLLIPSLGWSYSFSNFTDDIVNDTKKELGKGLKAAYFYDFLEKDIPARNKVGASAPILSWKFITLEPAFIYTPTDSNKVGEIGLAFPIHITKIPVSNGKTVGDYLKRFYTDESTGKWTDRLYGGFYMAHNLTTGKFGFGYSAGVRF